MRALVIAVLAAVLFWLAVTATGAGDAVVVTSERAAVAGAARDRGPGETRKTQAVRTAPRRRASLSADEASAAAAAPADPAPSDIRRVETGAASDERAAAASLVVAGPAGPDPNVTTTAPGQEAPRRTGSGRRPTGVTTGFHDWTLWWAHNREEIFGRLAPRDRSRRAATDAAIRELAVPALRAAIARRDENFDVVSAAILALAKIGDEASIGPLVAIVRNAAGATSDRPDHRFVEESAAVGLGLMGCATPDVCEALAAVVRAPARPGTFVRPFAAASLGRLAGTGTADPATRDVLLGAATAVEADENIRPAALLGLGLLRDANAQESLLAILRTGLRDDATSLDAEIACAIEALGRIGRPGLAGRADDTSLLDAVTAALGAGGVNRVNVRRSAAIALGTIGANCDESTQLKLLATLDAGVESATDASERSFALIAIGRIGGAPGTSARVRRECVAALDARLLVESEPAAPFAALALGLIGLELRLEGRPVDAAKILGPIRERWARERDTRVRGAYAIASGLAGDLSAADSLIAVLNDTHVDARLCGHAAVALGLMQATAARPAIVAALLQHVERELVFNAAIGARLLGDVEAVPDLVAVLDRTDESQYVLGSAALALGRLGDARAVASLVRIQADDKTYPDLTRALAIVALGQIGDRADVPVLARAATDVNYRNRVPALTELLTIL